MTYKERYRRDHRKEIKRAEILKEVVSGVLTALMQILAIVSILAISIGFSTVESMNFWSFLFIFAGISVLTLLSYADGMEDEP